MEVHHHAHTPRKKWTHYFWEFLMLFLAVFCGFLAENKREHIVENHRAKDYAHSLYFDLKEDTAELRLAIRQTEFLMSISDSLNHIPLTSQTTVPGIFYYYSRFTSTAYIVDWSRSTIEQLVQSGNLRYFKNKQLVQKVNAYYALQDMISSQNQTDRDHRNTIMDVRNEILQNRIYALFAPLKITKEQFGHDPDPLIDSLMAAPLPIQAEGYKKIDLYLNLNTDRRWRLDPLVNTYYRQALDDAAAILNEINKTYHFN
ncbi:MAG: hypothetical protein U0U70_16920 [Chitinophagaceae bacterium]